MAKQNKSTSRKAAPRANRGGASKPGDKLRLQGHGADRAGSSDERIAQPAGAEARDASRAGDDRRGSDRDRQDAQRQSDARDARRNENR
jgi:hypothetical protein